MTSHCMGNEQMKSEIMIRKREEMAFKTRAKGRGRWSRGNMYKMFTTEKVLNVGIKVQHPVAY